MIKIGNPVKYRIGLCNFIGHKHWLKTELSDTKHKTDVCMRCGYVKGIGYADEGVKYYPVKDYFS